MNELDALLPFLATCPACGGDSGPGERYDGEEYRCDNCREWLVATCMVDLHGNHMFQAIGFGRRPMDERTHRQRNRARKNRRGW